MHLQRMVGLEETLRLINPILQTKVNKPNTTIVIWARLQMLRRVIVHSIIIKTLTILSIKLMFPAKLSFSHPKARIMDNSKFSRNAPVEILFLLQLWQKKNWKLESLGKLLLKNSQQRKSDGIKNGWSNNRSNSKISRAKTTSQLLKTSTCKISKKSTR